jgi:hypothetical protein
LVYSYLLSILHPFYKIIRDWILRNYCHRTGKRYQEVKQPLYRLRWAISRLWQHVRPVFDSALFAPLEGPNMCSENSG